MEQVPLCAAGPTSRVRETSEYAGGNALSVCRGGFAVMVVLFASMTVTAQQKPLSPEARRLSDALAELQKKPGDSVVQEQYLRAFPHDYKSFLALFDLDRELSDGYEFIMVLSSLSKDQEAQVGRLVVQLSKDARWDADAPNYLEYQTVVYGVQHTKTFANLLQQLSPAEQANLITFCAHAENFAAYPQFQGLIDNLRSFGQNDLAKEFETARAARERLNSR